MKKNTGSIVFITAGLIYILFNFIVTSFVIAENPDESVNAGITFLAELVAFIPVAGFIFLMKRLYTTQRDIFTTLSFRTVAIHFGIFIFFIAIHAAWQVFFNSIFFDFDFTLAMLVRDMIGFLNLRVMIYIITIGLIIGVVKIQEKENYLLQQSELKLELQKISFRELELKLNPEIIYPNLDFIKEHVYDKPSRASQLVLNLSKQLRILIDSLDEERVTVKQDLLFFEYYFQALQLRLEKSLILQTDVEERYLNAKVPSLVLLVPFLEELNFGAYAGFTDRVERVHYRSGKSKKGYAVFSIHLSPVYHAMQLKKKLEQDQKLIEVNRLLRNYKESSLTVEGTGNRLSINLSINTG